MCLTCDGPSSLDCISCPNSAVLQLDKSCLCINQTFWSGSSCESCNKECFNCSGPLDTNCSSCYPSASLLLKFSCTCEKLTILWEI